MERRRSVPTAQQHYRRGERLAQRSLHGPHPIAAIGEKLPGEIERNAPSPFAEMDDDEDAGCAHIDVRAFAAHRAEPIDDGVLGALLDEAGVGKPGGAAARRHGESLAAGEQLLPLEAAHAFVQRLG